METISTESGTLEKQIHVKGVVIGETLAANVNFQQKAVMDGEVILKPWGALHEVGPEQYTLSPEETVAVLALPSHVEQIERLHEIRREKRDEEIARLAALEEGEE